MKLRISNYLLVGLTTLLVACGGGGGGSSSSSSSGGNSPPDTTPVTFTFSNQGGQTPSTAVTSNEITITGINAAAPISITGGEYSIEGGAFTSVAGTVSNNQRVRIRLTASPQFSTALTATLTVGGVSAAFTATTVDADTTPAAFQFAFGVNATRGSWISSDAVTISGINTSTPVSIEGGEYSIAGGAFTNAAGTVVSGQSITVRVRASTDYSRITRARLTVGTVTQVFEATSELPSYLPDAVAFDGADTVYLLSATNRFVFRWSLADSRYLDAIVLEAGASPATALVYSPSHQRLYVGYGTGDIRQIAVTTATPTETAFATVAGGVSGLGAAGNFITVQTSGYGGGQIFNGSGVSVGQGGYYYGYSRETAYDPVTQRVYFTRDGLSPNDLHFDVINQTTGAVSSTGETPYHGSYNIQPPIRVSNDGQYVLLGSGDIYSQANLDWSGSVGAQIADARWFANGSLVTLTTTSTQTTLRRLSSSNLSVLEQRNFPGQAIRVVGTDTAMAVVVASGNNVQIHAYVPDDDSDDDGVQNTQDAFPLDRAASVDTDRDGFPDAWTTGLGAGDSTTGLALDAFPNDAACWLSAHGSGGVCNYGATIPNYVPEQIAHHGDVIYLLSEQNRRVYRWSISTRAYLNPYVVGTNQGFATTAPTAITYSSAQQRLYLGYPSGAIRYIDTASTSPAEIQFANAAYGITSLNSAGNYLAVQAGGYYGGGALYNASGAITAQGGYYYGYSRETAWDPVNSRLYFTRDGISPNDLHYEVINQSTGAITASGETPYHGDYGFGGVIRVSASGENILLGTGDIFAQSTMTWAGSVGGAVADARWFANGSLVTLSTGNNQTTLRRLGATQLNVVEQLTYTGNALRIVGSDTSMAIVLVSGNNVQFVSYLPDDDSDDDGVANAQDAFPLDLAASVDTDRDGRPDTWNAGRSQADSTTGLTLDAFPNDSACWLDAHGAGGVCNYGATVPNYTPDQIAHQGDVVYLLSADNRRVYRWSISGSQYLNPYVVGINQGFTTIAPTTIAYQPAQQRLYLGYPNGAIRYIDATSASPAEVPFAIAARGVTGLSTAGNYLAAHVGGGYDGGYLYNANGVITDQGGYYYGFSREMAWDPVNSRLYYTHDGLSPNDLQYDVINQTTGEITATAETPYHGTYSIAPPIRVSVNGQYVLLGSGDIYAQNGLTWAGSLGAALSDARWFTDGSLVALMSSNNQVLLRRFGATNLVVQEALTFPGSALRVVGSDTAMVVIVSNNGAVQFHEYAPSNDSDADGVVNTADAFPLDVAASLDSDLDGRPDSWNAGRSAADSTTGLTLDAFPSDSACWEVSHGSGGVCNYGATIPAYTPDKIVSHGDVIYLLSGANRRVYRWSMATGAYLNPYVIGLNQGFTTVAPTHMEFSASHNRLYLGYASGAVRYLDITSGNPVETAFASLPAAVNGLGAAGNFLVAQATDTYVFDSSGSTLSQSPGYYYYYARDFAWDAVNSRLYYVDGFSSSYLYYLTINQGTGQVTSSGQSTYPGGNGLTIQAPVRVAADGTQVVLGNGDIYGGASLARTASIGKVLKDAFWSGNLLVSLDTNDHVEIRHARTRTLLHSYPYVGTPLRVLLGQTEVYLVHVMNGTTAFQRLAFFDQDADGIARWFEQRHNLSDLNAADAPLDPDADGLDNLAEFQNLTDPASADTDGDGLTDSAEVNTWNTSPLVADSDADGLNDYAEVTTHASDPLDADSDNDGYSDLDEVLYGGDPNDSSDLPQPLTNYTQTFEGSPDLAAWLTPVSSAAPWALSTAQAHGGVRSFKSGAVGAAQISSVKFRGVFAAGTLRFWARLDPGYCCNRLYAFVDGQQVAYIYGDVWSQYSIAISPGIREIEWRYERDSYSGQVTDAAYIDDVTFAP